MLQAAVRTMATVRKAVMIMMMMMMMTTATTTAPAVRKVVVDGGEDAKTEREAAASCAKGLYPKDCVSPTPGL